jgi:hypothetical protein
MPKLRLYQIFISHSWAFDEYHRIKKFLKATPNLHIRDFSIPFDNSLDTRNKTELRKAIRRLISRTHIVLVPAGMEVYYRYWVKLELQYAQDLQKPIVGIAPLGQQKFPKMVSDVAQEIVGWRRESIVNAIRRHSL